MNTKLQSAKRNFNDAHKRLAAATAQAAPVGCRVVVTLGRARIIGTVLWSGQSWNDPSRVGIENLKTGKVRCFSATYHPWERLGV